jgi:hypothetical protein
MQSYGNTSFLSLPTTAFLCSQQCPAGIVLKSYDWAKQQRNEGRCVVCGNHSIIECDVFDILLRGEQPLVLVLARGLKTKWDPEIERAVQANRLLVLSPFEKSIKRVTRETAFVRNKAIIQLSSKIVVGYKTPNGQLDGLLEGCIYESV